MNSYLIEKNYFRYIFPHKAPENKSLVYFPYWRFKGMLFSCLPGGIKNRFMDMSYQAAESSLFPISVGLRSQAMKLKFVSPESKGFFIKPVTPFKNIMDIFIRRFNADMPKPILHQAHIGETLSLIYSPFYIENKVMDAVLNQPVSSTLDDDFEIKSFKGGPANWGITFVPTLCPGCGWDLEGQRDSLALICNNCKSVWKADKKGLKKLNTAHLPPNNPDGILFLPFWRIKAEIKGVRLESFADMVRLANLPKVVQNGWDKKEFCFWGPAFKVRPQSFLRLTTAVTISQPSGKLIPGTPKNRMHQVNLPVKESVEALKLNLSNFIRPKNRLVDDLPLIEIKPKSYLLVYLPFEVRHHDLVYSDFNIAINKNQMALSGNL